VRAQPAGKRPRVGILSPLPRPHPEPWARHEPGAVALAQLGWIEGRTVEFEPAFAAGREDRLPELARDLVRKGVDLIWARTAESAIAAARATQTIPIVFANVALPLEVGLVDSLARPGRNATGVAFVTDAAQPAKPIEFIRQLAPGAGRVGAIWSAHNFETVSGGEYQGNYALFERSIRDLGFAYRSENVAVPADYEAAFAKLLEWRADTLLALSTPINFRERHRIVAFVKRHRLPSAHDSRPFAEAGGLVAYGPLPREIAAQSARHVDRILRGARPAELAVELPRKFELTINLATARELGLTAPPSLLLRADRVIQ
jgi:putative ABC transport system substrate-binding protein